MFGIDQSEDELVAHFFVRFVRWQVEDEIARKVELLQLGEWFKKLVGHTLPFQCNRDHVPLDRIIELTFNCASKKARRTFDSTKIYYLANFLTAKQRLLAMELMQKIHGDYYRENLIHEFERSIPPLCFGDRDRFLSSVRGFGSEQRRLS